MGQNNQKQKESRTRRRIVFFLHAPEHDLIKIGTCVSAAYLKAIFPTIQLASPCKLHLVATAGKLHARSVMDNLEGYRAHGNWFHCTPELKAFIAQLENADLSGVRGVRLLDTPIIMEQLSPEKQALNKLMDDLKV